MASYQPAVLSYSVQPAESERLPGNVAAPGNPRTPSPATPSNRGDSTLWSQCICTVMQVPKRRVTEDPYDAKH